MFALKVAVCALSLVFLSVDAIPSKPWYQEPPLFPPYFTTSWILYNIRRPDLSPPFPDEPPLPYDAGRGRSYYTPLKEQMVEQYEDFCVPIFVNGSNWKCNFLNTGGVAYMISLTKSPYPPCCVFGKPWNPPHRNITSIMKYTNTTQLKGRTVDWWVLDCPGPSCPFWYGFYRDLLPGGYREPASFNAPVWKGWMTLRFFGMKVEEPPSSVYDIPDICVGAKDCGYLSEQ